MEVHVQAAPTGARNDPVAAVAPEKAVPPGGLGAVLAQPNFRWYWFGLLGMTFALDIQRFTVPWLAYHLTGSPLAVGLVALALGLPNILLSPIGGVMANYALTHTLVPLGGARMGVLAAQVGAPVAVAIGGVVLLAVVAAVAALVPAIRALT